MIAYFDCEGTVTIKNTETDEGKSSNTLTTVIIVIIVIIVVGIIAYYCYNSLIKYSIVLSLSSLSKIFPPKIDE